MGKRRRPASSANARGARARKAATTKHATPTPDSKPVLSFSKILECVDNVFSALGPSVDSVSESVSPVRSKDETPTAKGTTVCRPPVEVDYKTLRDTLRGSPEHFETMLLQTIDLVHNLCYEADILHGNITPGVIMCDIVDDSPQFFFVDLDHAPGIIGVDPLDPTESRSGHLAHSYPFMSPEVVDTLMIPEYRDILPHEPAYDFTSLFWVAVWCVDKIEDVADDTDGDDTDAQGRRHMWRDEPLYDVSWAKSWILDLYSRRQLSSTPAFERYLPMLERWRDLHARLRTDNRIRRMPRTTWMGSDGLRRCRIYEPIYTLPIQRSTIREAILGESDVAE